MRYLKEDKTMIAIFRATRQKLKDLRITPRESYDEIINRLIKNAK